MSFEEMMKAAHAVYCKACDEAIDAEFTRLVATGLTEQEAASMVMVKTQNVSKEIAEGQQG
jgi:hypothetical protein